MVECYAECRKFALYAECHYDKCHYADCHGALPPSFIKQGNQLMLKPKSAAVNTLLGSPTQLTNKTGGSLVPTKYCPKINIKFMD
jgi:hypothetical protein